MKYETYDTIRNRYFVYNALFEITQYHWEEWRDMTPEDVLGMVMRKTKGRLNPAYVLQLLDEMGERPC